MLCTQETSWHQIRLNVQIYNGVGQIISSKPFRDDDERKFWIHTARFKNTDGCFFEKDIKYLLRILILFCFLIKTPKICPEKRKEIQQRIKSLIEDGIFSEDETNEWLSFLDSFPNSVDSIDGLESFELPPAQTICSSRHQHGLDIRIDDGSREIDVVQHNNFTGADRRKKRRLVEQHVPKAQ